MPEQLPLWLIAGSLSLNVVFLRRMLGKLDRLYDYVVGQPGKRGLGDRVIELEKQLGIADEVGYRGPERRRWPRTFSRQRKNDDT